jgi:glycosyltransferase involved in cell wall biosynthesis
MFPFRYFTDANDEVLPIVAVTGFFRDKAAEQRFYEYKEKGIAIFGITAYKSFPNRSLLDKSEGEYERNDTFDFTAEIRDWLCCFKNASKYGFTQANRLIDMSESDFYNSEMDKEKKPKKYDFVYICCKDSDTCPLDGWNAHNRNFDLALKCFPILCNEFNMKGMIVGRVGCGLEEKYREKLEVVEWLDWHVLQEKMRESRMLFVPNIYDASPRVVAECITKDVPVLMNKNILCGSKYITYETGELFSDENDLRPALTNLVNKQHKISPKKWWSDNYSNEKCQKKLRDFLYESFPSALSGVDRVKFIL